MTSIMKHDATSYPLQMGLFRPEGQLPGAHPLPGHVEQTATFRHVGYLPGGLQDTPPLRRQSKQASARKSIAISDGFGVFRHPDSVIYI